MAEPLRVANLVLDKVLEKVPREHKSAEATDHGPSEHDWHRK